MCLLGLIRMTKLKAEGERFRDFLHLMSSKYVGRLDATRTQQQSSSALLMEESSFYPSIFH